MNAVTGAQILEMMKEGKKYSRQSFLQMFPEADERLVIDSVSKLVNKGLIWNGNMFSYIKFPPRNPSDAVAIQVGPSHEWGDLKGYETNLKSHRALSESTRGDGYKARPTSFAQFDGRPGDSFQARNTAIIKGLL